MITAKINFDKALICANANTLHYLLLSRVSTVPPCQVWCHSKRYVSPTLLRLPTVLKASGQE